MKHEEYMEMFYPVIDRVARYAVECEKKHGAGITFKSDDATAAAGHLIDHHRGKHNPDGESHAVAALLRTIKVVMAEN